MSNLCQLWLTCADQAEASRIANVLLAERFIACAKQIPVTADFRWQGKIDKSNEVLLVMDSRINLFEQVEQEVKKLHSYDTFVLQATPIVKTSMGAKRWIKEELES